MALDFECPSCGRKLRVRESAIGKNVRCPGCRKTFAVPAAFSPEEEPQPEVRVVRKAQQPTVLEPVAVLELAPCPAKGIRGFPVWPIIIGSFVFLSCIGLLLIVSVLSAPWIARNQANQTESLAQEGPIQVGKYRITWTRWSIGQLSMHDVYGIGAMHVTRDDCFKIEFRIENMTETEILDFPGLRQCEPILEDAFGNSYRQIKREPGYEWSGALFDESYVGAHGNPIHPGKPRKDYLAFEPPLVKAEQLTLTLSARRLGGHGRVQMLIPSHQKTDQEKDADDIANWEKRLKTDAHLHQLIRDHPDARIAGEPEAIYQKRRKDPQKWLQDHPPPPAGPARGMFPGHKSNGSGPDEEFTGWN